MAPFPTPDYAPLIYWVQERDRIREARAAGLSQSEWTTDPILKKYRFCNVRREDDRVTIWVRENIRVPYATNPNLWFMLCIARQINLPETLQELIDVEAWPFTEAFEPGAMTAALKARKARGAQLYTGAYMIPAPKKKGACKQTHIAEVVLGGLWRRREEISPLVHGNQARSLQAVHAALRETPFMGDFLAYQAVVDMRFTKILEVAADRSTWAAAGPGTRRGLNRLHGRPVGFQLSQAAALAEMRDIYGFIENETGVQMDFSDVPNILCEVDKYLRVKNGDGTPRALFVPVDGQGVLI